MLFWKSLYSLGSDVEGLNYLGYVMIDHTSVTMYYYIYKYIYIYIYKKKRKKKRINIYCGVFMALMILQK